ncbi:MAG TPA: ABC transporter substrate-binding protein [Chloroflexota bacterium]|nr:ABC transporter substrate-binding protein [Chloroflexota bacterium]
MTRAALTLLLCGLLTSLAGCSAPAARPAAPAPTTQAAPPSSSGAASPAPAAPATAAPPSPPPLESLKMGLPAMTATFAPMFIAAEKGYFAEEGLAVELVTASANVSIASLLTGEMQFSGSGASAVSAALKGADLKVVYTSADRPLSELWSAAPEIRTLENLPGKAVGVQSRGDSTELALRIALLGHGIDPGALTYIAVGVGPQRLAAIQAGSVAAAALLTTEVAEVRDAVPGAHRVANLRDEARMVYGGVATHARELQEHRERTRRFLRAVMKSREYYKAFRDETVQILMKYSQSPLAANEASYDETLWTMDGDASVPVEVQRRDTAARAQLNGLDDYPPAEQIYDYSLVQQVYRELQASGWQPAR